MKNKFFKRKDPELEEDEEGTEEIGAQEEAEVDSGGPVIASAKKNKMMVVAASSVLITAVIYFIFFKGEAPKDNLEPVAPVIRPTDVARSESGKSPFEIEPVEERRTDNDVALLQKPKAPDVPKLPELKQDDKKEGLLLLDDIESKEPPKKVPEELPILPNSAEQKSAESPQANQQPSPAVQPDQAYTDPKYAPIIVLSGSGGPTRSIGYDKNIISLNTDSVNNLEKSKVGVKTTFVDNRMNVIAQGKLLTAVLETAINTEIPGFVRAIVSRDVYGEAGSEVLISRGSRLFGIYSSEVSRGQGRVQISWTRLIRPDGVDLAISSSASDQFGRAGIPGSVDNKYGSVIASSLLTSILAVAGVATAEALIGGNGDTTTTTNPQQGSTTTTGGASNQAIYNVSKTITDTVTKLVNEKLDARPIIMISQGTRITVIVNADMNIPSIRK